MRMVCRLVALVFMVPALTALAAGVADAQTFTIRLEHDSTARPVSGALVQLRAASGDWSGQALSSAQGVVRMVLPSPGAYTMLVRRIGAAPFETQLQFEPDNARDIRVRVPYRPVQLAAMTTSTVEQCGAIADTTPDGRRQTADLLREIQTALEISELTHRQQLVRTSVELFVRDLRTNGSVQREQTALTGISGARPFSALEPAELAEFGYVRDNVDGSAEYYAPDAPTLLSSTFLETHCFRVRREPMPSDPAEPRAPRVARANAVTAASERIGLAFSPVAGRTQPEIAGVVWVDAETNALLRVEFTYVNRPLPRGAKGVGGHVAYTQTEAGAWFVSDWRIRMPLSRARADTRSRPRLAGYREFGGRAVSVTDAEIREALERVTASLGAISGYVTTPDEETGVPDVLIRLESSDVAVRTDSAGAFRFGALSPGSYTLQLTGTPVVNFLPELARFTLPLDSAQEQSIRLAVPSEADVAIHLTGAVCPGTRRLLFGRVRDVATADSVGGAAVEVLFNALGVTERVGGDEVNRPDAVGTADAQGRFGVCVPAGVPNAVRARSGALRSPWMQLEEVREGRPVDLWLDLPVASGSGAFPGA